MLEDNFNLGETVSYQDIRRMAIQIHDHDDLFKASASWIFTLVNNLRLKYKYRIFFNRADKQ